MSHRAARDRRYPTILLQGTRRVRPQEFRKPRRTSSGSATAAVIVRMTSNEAAYVTGQTLHVNGGMAMI